MTVKKCELKLRFETRKMDFLVSGLSKKQMYEEIEALLDMRPYSRILAINYETFTESDISLLADSHLVYVKYRSDILTWSYGIVKHRYGPITKAVKNRLPK